MGLPVVVIRFFNAYGTRLDSPETGRVISVFIGKILSGKPIRIVGSGKQTRCFTYVTDTVEGIIKAANNPNAVGQAFNIGTDVETSVIELAHELIRIAGREAEIIYVDNDEYGIGYEDIYRRIPDLTKARTILGFEPKIDINDGLNRTYKWFKNNWDFLWKERLQWMQ